MIWMKRFLFTDSNNLYSNDLNWNIYVPVDVFLVMVQIISDQLKKKIKVEFTSTVDCVLSFLSASTRSNSSPHICGMIPFWLGSSRPIIV